MTATINDDTLDTDSAEVTKITTSIANSGGLQVKVATLVRSAAVVVAVAVIGVLGLLVVQKSGDLDDMRSMRTMEDRAEKTALDYAVGAATMSFEDSQGWATRLTAGTSSELAARLREAAASMQQLIGPLRWTSTARPIAATVLLEKNGVYEVACFVAVDTKNLQAPDGIVSTATYKLSLDSDDDWKITAITGIGMPFDETKAPAEGVPTAPN